MDLVLSADEIAAVTDRVRPSAQRRVLRALGIDHKTRPDGSLLVLRKSLQADLPNAKVVPSFAIDWGD